MLVTSKELYKIAWEDYYELRTAQIEGMKECLEHYYGVFQTKKYR